jgi:hypothetical protein
MGTVAGRRRDRETYRFVERKKGMEEGRKREKKKASI